MFINPIQMNSIQMNSIGMNPIGANDFFGNKKTGQKQTGFSDIFKDAWNTAEETQDDLAKKQYLQSIGEIDDTHTVPIAASQAELSLSLLVSLRNKALESYNELIRMSV